MEPASQSEIELRKFYAAIQISLFPFSSPLTDKELEKVIRRHNQFFRESLSVTDLVRAIILKYSF